MEIYKRKLRLTFLWSDKDLEKSRVGQPLLGHALRSDNSTLTFNNSRTTEEKTVLFGFVVYAAFCDVNTYCGLRNKPFVNRRKTFFSRQPRSKWS